MKSTTARIVLPLSLLVTAGAGTAAFAAAPNTYYPPPSNCKTIYNQDGTYVGYEFGSGRVGECTGSGDFIYEPYARVMTGTNKGVVVNDGLDGELYGGWVSLSQVCVQDSWSPTCHAIPPIPPIERAPER